MNPGKEYLLTAIRRMKYYKDLGDKTFEQLNDGDIHFLASPESNSIAVIVQHMTGNMLSRWTNFLTEDGEKSWRDRESEFVDQHLSKKVMIAEWEKGWKCFLDALGSLHEDDLVKPITIRDESLTVVDAINRQMAHYPYHIGQIIFIAKMLKNEDWKTLSIPKGQSQAYNKGEHVKDPAKKFS